MTVPAVERLRLRKRRMEEPLAVMARVIWLPLAHFAKSTENHTNF